MLIPADKDVRDDCRQFQIIGGVARMPQHVRTEGTDGGKRHGDAGVALLNFHAATMRGGGQRWRPLVDAPAPPSKLDQDWIPA